MSVFRSDSRQVPGPYAWTFAGLAVDADGACYSAERTALRDIKPKGLLVKYPNPFGAGGTPEVLYETSDPAQGVMRMSSGEIYLYGKKLHLPHKGTWKAKNVAQRGQSIVRISGAGGRLWVALGWPDGYGEFVDNELKALPLELEGICESICGTAPDDVYVSARTGIVHYDGTGWQRVSNAPENARLACVSGDTVYATGIEPGEGAVYALYRGSAKAGFKGTIRLKSVEGDGSFNGVFHAMGSIFLTRSGEGFGGLYELKKDMLEPLMHATGYTGQVAGNEHVLWVSNGIELLCYNGKEWRAVERVHHDKTKWPKGS